MISADVIRVLSNKEQYRKQDIFIKSIEIEVIDAASNGEHSITIPYNMIYEDAYVQRVFCDAGYKHKAISVTRNLYSNMGCVYGVYTQKEKIEISW